MAAAATAVVKDMGGHKLTISKQPPLAKTTEQFYWTVYVTVYTNTKIVEKEIPNKKEKITTVTMSEAQQPIFFNSSHKDAPARDDFGALIFKCACKSIPKIKWCRYTIEHIESLGTTHHSQICDEDNGEYRFLVCFRKPTPGDRFRFTTAITNIQAKTVMAPGAAQFYHDFIDAFPGAFITSISRLN